MADLQNIAQVELIKAWQEVVAGDQVVAQLIETIYVSNTSGATRTFRLALVLAGESSTPANKTMLFYEGTLGAGDTTVKETDIGLLPGDRLFGYADGAALAVNALTGVAVNVFGQQTNIPSVMGALVDV